MAIINCPNCGRQNPEGTRFCGGCGTQIPQNAAPANPAPEAQAYRPNLVKPSAPQAPAQPQYYAPPRGYQQPVYQQAPAYAVNRSPAKNERKVFILIFALALAGVVLSFISLIFTLKGLPFINILRVFGNRMVGYLFTFLVPLILFLLVRNENQKSLRKTAFIISIVVLVLQLVACCVYAYMIYFANGVPAFWGRICGSNLIWSLISFFRSLIHFIPHALIMNLVSMLAALCFVVKNVILCVTLGKIAKR